MKKYIEVQGFYIENCAHNPRHIVRWINLECRLDDNRRYHRRYKEDQI